VTNPTSPGHFVRLCLVSFTSQHSIAHHPEHAILYPSLPPYCSRGGLYDALKPPEDVDELLPWRQPSCQSGQLCFPQGENEDGRSCREVSFSFPAHLDPPAHYGHHYPRNEKSTPPPTTSNPPPSCIPDVPRRPEICLRLIGGWVGVVEVFRRQYTLLVRNILLKAHRRLVQRAPNITSQLLAYNCTFPSAKFPKRPDLSKN
jgi:hypothetical protein